MTKSRVEDLIAQLKLQEPSGDLDDRVGQILKSTDVPSQRMTPASRLTYLIPSMLAVVCLLIGVWVGRVSMTRTVAQVAAGQRESTSVARNAEFASNDQRTGVGYEQPILTNLQGPPVAIMCSMAEQANPEGSEQRCRKCHVRNANAENHFGEGVAFVLSLHRGLCAKCHDETEDWDPKQINDPFFRRQLEKVPDHDLPTG